MVTVEDLGLPDAVLWFLEGAIPPRGGRLRGVLSLAGAYLPRSLGLGGRGPPVGAGMDALLAGGRTPHSMPYLGMGTDTSDGTMRLENGALEIDWSPRRNRRMYREIERLMRRDQRGAGGRASPRASCGDGRCARRSPPTRSEGVRWATIRRRASPITEDRSGAIPGCTWSTAPISERAGRQSVTHDHGPGRAGGVLHGPRPGDDRIRRPGCPRTAEPGGIDDNRRSTRQAGAGRPVHAERRHELNLINVRGDRAADARSRDARARRRSAGQHLPRARRDAPSSTRSIDDGYDVWLENWRASIDLPRNEWTLDQAARLRPPGGRPHGRERDRRRQIKAIIHCQGSTSFAMSAMAGLVPEVDTIVTNAVSLHPIVPRWSRAQDALRPAGGRAGCCDTSTPRGATRRPRAANGDDAAVKATHHECKNTVCKLVSFTYGAGFPALWRHENLNDDTHT